MSEEKSNKDKAIDCIKQASTNLNTAHSLLLNANALAADIPAIRDLLTVSKSLTQTMMDISRLRGL